MMDHPFHIRTCSSSLKKNSSTPLSSSFHQKSNKPGEKQHVLAPPLKPHSSLSLRGVSMSSASFDAENATSSFIPHRTGGCLCGKVRYTLQNDPFIVHACHCTDCQKLTGSAFVINAWTEATNLEFQNGNDDGGAKVAGAAPPSTLAEAILKGGSGRPHTVFYCPSCSTAIYSHYQSKRSVFVRVGTLDNPSSLPPDVHIWTRSKVKWLDLKSSDASNMVFPEYYDMKQVWKPESLERFQILRQAAKKQKEVEQQRQSKSKL